MRDSLEEKLDFETKSRTVGCKKQLESFSFFFELNLGQKFYAHTDNLSRTMQQKKMSAVKGKELADLTVKTLQAMKNDRGFSLFYETTKKSTSTIKEISTPGVPRKRKRPNYCRLQYIESNLSTTGEAYYPETAVDHFKLMYMEAIDAIINSIKDRFEQPRFKVFGQVEQLLLNLIRKDSVVDKIETFQANFKGDYDTNSLMAKLELLPVICGEFQPINLGDVVKVIQIFVSWKI